MPSSVHLILGGAGFMGSHLAEHLLGEGLPVRVFDLPGRAQSTVAPLSDRIEVYEGDFSHASDVERALQDVSVVFHLVGTTVPSTSNRNPIFDIESNLLPTLRLLDLCVRARVERVVFSSSGGTVYGRAETTSISETHSTEPLSSYGITKLMTEKYLSLFRHLHGLDYTVLRVANAYGPRLPVQGEQNVIGVFLARLKQGLPLTVWGDGSVRRDFIYVSDVAQAFWAAAQPSASQQVFNIGTGIGTSLIELIRLMEGVTGRKAEIQWQPARSVDAPENVLSPERARQDLGWHPTTDLRLGLLKTWEWILQDPEV